MDPVHALADWFSQPTDGPLGALKKMLAVTFETDADEEIDVDKLAQIAWATLQRHLRACGDGQ